jgi:exosortase C (VPDSG-CTERM-specific)
MVFSSDSTKVKTPPTPVITFAPAAKPQPAPARWRGFLLATVLLGLAFSLPLYAWLRLALTDSLYSYTPCIPVITAFLIRRRMKNRVTPFQPAPKIAATLFTAGITALAAGQCIPTNALVFDLSALLLFFTSFCAWFLGGVFMRQAAFPLTLLVFMVPLPDFFRQETEHFLQIGSAVVADWLFMLSGLPVIRDTLQFHLPGMNLEVAPECSGIHSSLILLILSLVAGHLCLRSPWKRAVLALVVIPLALLRNGFRIFVIGQLCVHYGAGMLASPIHRHGGPLFFALSLLLFFPLLIFLKKSETKP